MALVRVVLALEKQAHICRPVGGVVFPLLLTFEIHVNSVGGQHILEVPPLATGKSTRQLINVLCTDDYSQTLAQAPVHDRGNHLSILSPRLAN
ncbi:Uncharacterised protein [Mycobacteroides abscessus subsp. massiliense]|nr:Uncharacterised protein [Mycobacteroides abscessus subsp. massiliense]